ncbi:tetratricopeptide repeat protein [Kitasatospora phosalacinea]|uniref:tetratricopeptide repeat protein n=1 Tax=Kitasatospora phosalacinea TaxID=2065 RepID=UPI000AD4E222|nr:tetratricopeptide repeat protein [Kitasatospora phosalacinea]
MGWQWWRGKRRAERDGQSVSRVAAGASYRPPDGELVAMLAAAEAGDDVAMGDLGTVYYSNGEQKAALYWWERSWAAGNTVSGYNLGAHHSAAGDGNRAQVIWEQVAALGDPDAMLGLVKQALERGDAAGVDRWAPEILAQDQAFPITALGVAFRDDGDLDRAVHAFRRAEELGDAYAMEYRARLLADQGRTAEAVALLEKAATAQRML